ncbi:DUF2095 family protein [Desulfurococcaceae archaeon MEX13E-LK6-19]|nr:DUF2095 family protein [Desulfurococcaceae archaeon MEX13E-LK6-19]
MRMSIDEFKKKYPNLYRELTSDDSMSMTLSVEKPFDDPWRGYIPGPIDYLRRAKTVEEAVRVIDYLLEHNEITEEEAREYKEKLMKEGLEAFGPRKESGYYYRKAVEYWRKKLISGGQRQQQS